MTQLPGHRSPGPIGLYDPANEHDACGVAFVVDMHGRRSRDIVDKAITALLNLEHRGAAGAEPNSGDGAGILIQIPDRFFRAIVDFELPPEGSYASGIAFLPQARREAARAAYGVEKIVKEEGLEVLGWREVPIDDSSLGALSRDAMPTFRQIFIASPRNGAEQLSGMDLERRAYVIRKRVEHELGTQGAGEGATGRETVYFPSLSGQTFVYKGMFTTPQLRAFYLDLQDDRVESALGIVHSRFSTNTFPSWPLAHPFRRVAHNGEINTVTGNENWMRAREALLNSDVFGTDAAGKNRLEKIFPVCTPGASDTACTRPRGGEACPRQVPTEWDPPGESGRHAPVLSSAVATAERELASNAVLRSPGSPRSAIELARRQAAEDVDASRAKAAEDADASRAKATEGDHPRLAGACRDGRALTACRLHSLAGFTPMSSAAVVTNAAVVTVRARWRKSGECRPG